MALLSPYILSSLTFNSLCYKKLIVSSYSYKTENNSNLKNWFSYFILRCLYELLNLTFLVRFSILLILLSLQLKEWIF